MCPKMIVRCFVLVMLLITVATVVGWIYEPIPRMCTVYTAAIAAAIAGSGFMYYRHKAMCHKPAKEVEPIVGPVNFATTPIQTTADINDEEVQAFFR